MKKIAFLIAAVMLLSGCAYHTELDKIAIVEIIGVDFADGKYTITMQYFNTDAAGGVTAVDSSAPNTVTVSASGRSIESALEAVSYTSGKEIMPGSAGLIIFGKDAITSFKDSVGFAVSHYSGNPQSYIAAADNAADIVNVKFSEGNASVEKLEMMLSGAENTGLTVQVKLYEALDMLCCPTGSLALPLLSEYKGNTDLTENGSNVIISGGALCTDSEYAADLSVDEMSGLGFLSCGSGKCEMTLRYRGDDVSVVLYGINTKITPSFEDDVLGLDIEVTAKCKYVGTDLEDPYSARGDIERLCAHEAEARITSLLEKTVTAYGADVCGLEYKIRSHSPEIWRAISENCREYLRNCRFDVRCKVNTERFGIMHG